MYSNFILIFIFRTNVYNSCCTSSNQTWQRCDQISGPFSLISFLFPISGRWLYVREAVELMIPACGLHVRNVNSKCGANNRSNDDKCGICWKRQSKIWILFRWSNRETDRLRWGIVLGKWVIFASRMAFVKMQLESKSSSWIGEKEANKTHLFPLFLHQTTTLSCEKKRGGAFLVNYTRQNQWQRWLLASVLVTNRFWVTQTKCEEMGDITKAEFTACINFTDINTCWWW